VSFYNAFNEFAERRAMAGDSHQLVRGIAGLSKPPHPALLSPTDGRRFGRAASVAQRMKSFPNPATDRYAAMEVRCSFRTAPQAAGNCGVQPMSKSATTSRPSSTLDAERGIPVISAKTENCETPLPGDCRFRRQRNAGLRPAHSPALALRVGRP